MKIGVNLINFGPGVTHQPLKSWALLSESLGDHLLMTSEQIAEAQHLASEWDAAHSPE